MSGIFRWVVIVLIFVHGLIHLLGAAKGLGWAKVDQMKEPISSTGGVVWLLAGVLVIAAAVSIALAKTTWWWAVAASAAFLSQAVIFTAWSDAKAGTVANVILVLTAIVGYASCGPSSPQALWHDKADAALRSTATGTQILEDEDLSSLPVPLAEYIRRSGAVGESRVVNLYAEFSGRIRGGPGRGWMVFTGKQVNTYGEVPQRLLLMNASLFGVPIVMTHLFDESSATMRGKVLSLMTVVDGSGPDMDRAETVTLFNDLVIMAPGAIPFAPVRWVAIDDHTVRGTFTRGFQQVSATLSFNHDFELTDFVSEDRLRSSQDGKSFTRMRWNTPISQYREIRGRKAAGFGEAQWHAPEPEGHFTYLEFRIDDLTYNLAPNALDTSAETCGPIGLVSEAIV